MHRPNSSAATAARLALAVMLTALAPLAAQSCECTLVRTLQEHFDASDGVFSGTVLSVQPTLNPDIELVMIQPITRWKGALDSPMPVFTGLNDGVCGYPFVVGQSYLVFALLTALGGGGRVSAFTDNCRPTSPLENNPYVSQLPPPVLPVPARTHTWGTLKSLYR